MTQKIIIGVLVLSIVGIVGFGLWDAARTGTETPEPEAVELVQPTISDASVAVTTEATQEPLVAQVNQSGVTAQNDVGEIWTAEGIITSLEDGYGVTLELPDGTTQYVELGPPTYWQAQGVTLAVGDTVYIDGFSNGTQVHARIVTINEQQLVLRTEAGQPMWSGGVENGQNGSGGGTGQTEVLVDPEDWVTLTSTITQIGNGSLTIQTEAGEVIALQLGQPNFWQSQEVTLNVDDAVEVLGFWQADQFMVGEIKKVDTGERIILRDPNGRQLWGGPGRNGNGNNGNGHSATPDSSDQSNSQEGALEVANQSNGQSQGQGNTSKGNSNGKGNQYRGGRG